MNRKDRLIVALDIGSTKTCALIGEREDDGGVKFIALGAAESKGWRKGQIVNLDLAVSSIRRAVEEAETVAGVPVESAVVGVAGSHVRGVNSRGGITVAARPRDIQQEDIRRAVEAARGVTLPEDREILHVLPQEFIIDKQEGVREPIGMCGVRLEAKVHIVTGAVSAAQNIIKCVRRCGLEVDDIILEQLASSLSVLTEDEKELGVCLIDIGGGTTDISVFTEGAIRHTAVIPIAGDQVTNDIAVALRTPTQHAEEIKKKYGCALTQLARSDESIEVPSVGDRAPRKLARQTLAEVVEPRVEELYGLVLADLRRSGFEDMVGSGIVLTGGSAKMEGMIELAEEVFHMPVRLGIPQYVGGLSGAVHNPIYATGVGLVLFGAKDRDGKHYDLHARREVPSLSGMLHKMKSWFQGNF